MWNILSTSPIKSKFDESSLLICQVEYCSKIKLRLEVFLVEFDLEMIVQ